MKLKLTILSLFLFAAACSSSESVTPATTAITEAPTTAVPTTVAPATTTPTTSVPKDTGHTHDEEGGHTDNTVETTVPETTTTSTTSGVTATTAAPTGDTTATTTAPPKRSSGGKISYINSPDACRRDPHNCDDPFSLPHIHILGTNKDGTGEQVLNTNPKHTHQEWWEHNHEIVKGLEDPIYGSDFYLRWDDSRTSRIGDRDWLTFAPVIFGSAE